MADLAAHVIREASPRGSMRLPITDEVTLYVGALVGAQAGFANHWAQGVNDLFYGIVTGGDARARDNVLEGEVDDTPDPNVRIDTTGVTLIGLNSVGDTPAQSKVGNQIYCTTSNTDDMTLDPAGTGIIQPIGYLSAFRTTTDVDVTLYTPTEYLANRGNVYSLSIPMDLNDLVTGDVVTNLAIPHRFKIIDFQWITDIPGSASDNATFTLEIGATATTGGVLVLDDNIGTQGIVIAATAITALNVGAAADTLTMVAGTVQDFSAGEGTFVIHIQDLGL